MANTGYRQIHPEMWDDPWFMDLNPNEKLVFIYMFSNTRASLSGLYEISMRQIEFHTRVSVNEIQKFLEKCQKDGKIINQDNYYFVVNLLKRHFNRSPKVIARVINDIDSIPDCKPKSVCIEKYSQMIGYRYHIDTQTHKDKDINKDKDEINPTPFRSLSLVFLEKTGLPEGSGGIPKYTGAINEMLELGVTPEILSEAIDTLIDKGYTIYNPGSCVKTCMNIITDRQNKKTRKQKTDNEGLAWLESELAKSEEVTNG